jgi:alkylation response protein AidB-like acyl-CoA dehydrogenase
VSPAWGLTEDQRRLRDEIRDFAEQEVRPRAAAIEADGGYPAALFEALAAARVLATAVPTAHGGRWLDYVGWAGVVEELARVSGVASLMAAYVKLVALPVELAGSEDQKRRLLPALASGELLGSYALTEPSAGSDPAAIETRAERRGPGWLLNGEKRFIGNAGISGVMVVFARTGEPGSRGISAFLVPGDAPGLSSTPLPTMGMVGWQLGAPRFEDVELPADGLLGGEGEGFKLAMAVFDRSRPGVAAQAVGIGQGATDLALHYALGRRTFGRPLVEHGAIQQKLAGMEAELAAARALTLEASAAADRGDPRVTKLASMAKLVAGDTAMRATTDAVQILGGNGYLREFPAERMMRDAKVCQIYEGPSEIQRLVIARQMAREAEAHDAARPHAQPAPE